MFLKKVLLLIGLISIIHAEPLHFMIQERVGNSYILFNSTIEGKAWIGIYKKDTSNEWKNVRKWEWATEPITKIDINFLATGDYEARLFFNNSFTTEKVIGFHMEAGPSQRANRLKDTTIDIGRSDNFTLDPVPYEQALNWVGVFNVGAEHNRANLLAWGYLEKENRVTIKTINEKKLPIGNYDLVYFIDDSYYQLGDTKTLTVGFDGKYALGIYKTHGFVLDSYDYINNIQQDKDWIAIFKKDDEPIRKNIIAWSYISEGIFPREDAKSSIIQFPKLADVIEEFEGVNYKVIIFEKDTYTILKTMTPVSI